MRTIHSVHGLWLTGVLGVGLLAGACNRTPTEEAARQRADNIEHQAEQTAERLRAQANTVEQRADQRADQIRDQAANTARAVDPARTEDTERRGPIISLAAARAQYAAARCERENGCNNIGQGRRYQSRDACITTASADRFDSWDSANCTRGVDASKLGDCLNAVREQSCGNPIDDISRMNACRGAAVCTTAETHVSSL